PRRPSAPMVLATGWPMLRLPDRAVDRLAASRTPPAPASRTPGTARALPGLPDAGETHDSVVESAHEAAAEVADVMGQHFTIMRQFLAVNENVLHAFLGGTAGCPAGEARLAPGPRRPLLGAVVSVVPTQELVARRRVDPAEDLYLRDHALGGAVSALDP